ncbi:Homeodomain-like transcriptional regulator, putative isoform 1 [Theobroma cacao]|uniref:Homeodomain-like transcriptional regulator, putative isoform 1 n=1 Tax=Theobroma cacao TaxID=3641 RepID=A0A061GFK3_THECC|nr:Homeodomain-like transcriptional regulator, putative isoform 1 [Theobroma cacao]EOY28163.1 Homeodomain-like transcriptional regulator, putative isoform 1 [Theobroma cacao]EOY28165.1 Homeodomain-like transcriptional regulator, putative isoform 1 [Theobroma cacao]
MDPGSEEENNPSKNPNKNVNSSNEGHVKPKRQMKTPYQLEALEKAYALETYPSEATRAGLSEKLGLSDRQLQMWFCHRRLKEKKETPSKKPRKGAALPPESPIDDLHAGPEPDYGSGSGSGSSPYTDSRKLGGSSSRGMTEDVPTARRYYESQQSIMELRAIACVEAQLGEPLRDDGPMLGMEFDPLPPDAFGAIPEPQKRSGHPYESKAYERHDGRSSKAAVRALHEYQFLPEHASLRSDAYGQVTQSHFHESPVDGARARATSFVHGEEPLPRVHGIQGHGSRVRVLPQQDKTGIIPTSSQVADDSLAERESFTNGRLNTQSIGHPVLGSEDSYVLSTGQTLNIDADLRNDRKRKSDENRIAREVEAHENRIRKELEKLDLKRRKSEERMRKEMERHARERRKEEERLVREKQREEERSQREQRREMERREKFLQKECLRAEKRRQKEELRREKEAERRRVAMEKATARKIAKESMDLIEDEQLELMELAAASKGIPSIIHLDHDSLQNLESFRDSLSLFPPKSVQLKRPFAIQPWIDSEENVGNLLMAWRFLITFADVLRLWPFTLDEFVQAFHDYDSRLLGEIHVALLKSIIKDIEDVARTPSTGLGMNQYCAANPEGGHPQIVEGAYSWGFDIRNWQRHLNPLTWPEIFRQLAISAGLGPQLKKRNAAWTFMGDNDEGKGCEDVVSTLRNGSAAENAFVLMREKGLLLPRRSRHRLTPGTVKFAAFHVLSLEGREGLTVLELADKIQKSGLRDLTTSKTPEASISVALTRDAKLFERIAPSTYCVRPAYRKDPTDAEAILAAARKKIRQFENGFLGGEDADEVERDEVERDEESECDVDEEPEVDDIATPSNANKDADYPKDEVNTCSGSGKVHVSTDALNVPSEFDKDFSSFPPNIMKDANGPSNTGQYVAREEMGTGNPDQQNIEIDESKSGESWIQGLSEGEYSHLSVEERLNALVALIGIANEGNSIRAVLEDRLEAANALKKQMWVEAQLDKSRLKEETMVKMDFPSMMGIKAEPQLPNSVVEGSQSPFPAAYNKNDEASPSIPDDQKPLLCSQNVQNDLNSYPAERALVLQEASMGPDNFSAQQIGHASKRSRSQLKSYIAHRAEEMYVYRSLPLGQDRRRNRYWQFVASASKNDPCSGRIFVELRDGNWRLIDSEEAFDTLLTSLDARGIRESHLRIMLQKIETSFKENVRRNLQCARAIGRSGSSTENEVSELDSSPDFPASFDSPSSAICGLNFDALETLPSFKIQLGRNENEKKLALKRYQDFQRWIWKECYNSSTLCAMKYGKKRCVQLLAVCDVCLRSHIPEEMHCGYCHQTFGSVNNSFNFSEHEIQCKENRKLDTKDTCTIDYSLPLGISLLKSLCALVEVSIPPEALESVWIEGRRKMWGRELNASSSVDELLKILTHLESAIKRDHLLSNFETTKELLGSNLQSESDSSVSVLPWIPETTAAVALRLLELDVSIMCVKQEKVEPSENKEARAYIKLPSRTSLFIKNKELELKELDQDEAMKEENFADMSHSKRNSYKRGRGGREQGSGRKWQRRASGSRYDTGKRSAREKNNLSFRLKQQGQRTNGRSSGRGRRTVRKRAERRAADNTMVARVADVIKPKVSDVRDLDEEWRTEKFRVMQMVNPPDSNSAEEESDDNAQGEGYGQGNWDLDYNGASNGWNAEAMEASDEDDDAYEDDNGVEQLGEEDSDGDLEISDASDVVANKAGNDDGSDLAVSEDYSD